MTCIFTHLSAINVLLNMWEEPRASPGVLRDHPCGELPIPRIQLHRLGNGECLLINGNRPRCSKLLLVLPSKLILRFGTHDKVFVGSKILKCLEMWPSRIQEGGSNTNAVCPALSAWFEPDRKHERNHFPCYSSTRQRNNGSYCLLVIKQ
jgi:hypothetical protein